MRKFIWICDYYLVLEPEREDKDGNIKYKLVEPSSERVSWEYILNNTKVRRVDSFLLEGQVDGTLIDKSIIYKKGLERYITIRND